MITAPLPPDEELRLAALQEYQVLDTPPELAYDDIAFLASQICGTPIAAVSLIDRNRQWFKAKVGFDAAETPRDVAFCAHAILDTGRPLVVEDARSDERFADNPLVTGDFSIRFYAGAPLVSPGGHALGTLCVIDQQPRVLNDEARQALEILSREVVSQLELRRALTRLDRTRIQQLQLKDQLFSHVSHELRSPLTVIAQFVSILLDGLAGPLEPVQREYLEIVDRNASQLGLMISDLVEVSRIKTGKFGLNRAAIEVQEVVAEVVQSLQVSAGTRGIELSSTVEPDLPLVHADPARVKQILTNLIENALKYTPEGGAITIAATRETDAEEMIAVSVADTGCGIAPEERERIFDQLYQIEDDSAEARKGLGLGLHICKDLVTAHGGTIGVESEPGRGATFAFTLPAITLTEWIAGLLARRLPPEGRVSLVSIACGPREGEPATDDLVRGVRRTLTERLPQDQRLLPGAARTASGHALFVLVPGEPGSETELTRKVGEWLASPQSPSTHGLAVESRVHRVPVRAAGDQDPYRATADAVVRVMDEIAHGWERQGAA